MTDARTCRAKIGPVASASKVHVSKLQNLWKQDLDSFDTPCKNEATLARVKSRFHLLQYSRHHAKITISTFSNPELQTSCTFGMPNGKKGRIC